jgi:hypothetical protein
MKRGVMVDLIGEDSDYIVRIELSATKDSSPRTVIVRRKVGTKEDGLLGLCCEWVAEIKLVSQDVAAHCV